MNHLITVAFLLSTFGAFAQDKSRGVVIESPGEETQGKTHLILMGISKYKNLPESKQLDFADDDAQLVGDYFSTVPEIKTTIFLNEQASSAKSLNLALKTILLQEAKAGDDVIIYFAGHGDVDTLMNDGFLLLHDVTPPLLDGYDYNEALSLAKLKTQINAASSKGVNVMFISDACHSGAINAKGPNEQIAQLSNDKVLSITSCQKNELSYESLEFGGHGVFTYYLVQGLIGFADENYDGKVDFEELERYVKKQVSDKTQKKQHPVFSGEQPSKILAEINKKQLELAKKNKLQFSELTAMSKSKSNEDEGRSQNPCNARMDLMLQRTLEGKFFSDELALEDKEILKIGPPQSIKAHGESVEYCEVSTNGLWVASSSNEGVAIFSSSDKKEVKWLARRSGFTKLNFSPDSKRLVAAFGKTVVCWSTTSLEEKWRKRKMPGVITSLQYLDDKRIAVGTTKGFLVEFDSENGEMTKHKIHRGAVTRIIKSKNVLVTSSLDGTIGRFDLLHSKSLSTLNMPRNIGVSDLLVIQGGTNAVTLGTDGVLIKWDLTKGTIIREMMRSSSMIKQLTTDRYETVVAALHGDGQLDVLEILSGAVLETWTGKDVSHSSVCYDQEYKRLYLGQKDGNITSIDFHTLPDASAAVDLHGYLKSCDCYESKNVTIDGTVIYGLSASVRSVLQNLVNGDTIGITKNKLENTLRYARKALDIGKRYEEDAALLEADVLMLEAYLKLLFGSNNELLEGKVILDRLAELVSDRAYFYNLSALYYLKLNELNQARAMINKAQSLSAVWIEPTYNKGIIYYASGENQVAEQNWKKTLACAPEHQRANLALVDYYLSLKRYDEARYYAYEWKKRDSSYVLPNQLIYASTNNGIEDLAVYSPGEKVHYGPYDGFVLSTNKAKGTGKVAIVLNERYNWSDLQNALKVNLAGFSGWKLPNADQLNEILSSSIFNLSVATGHVDYIGFWCSNKSTENQFSYWGTMGTRGFVLDKTVKNNLRNVILTKDVVNKISQNFDVQPKFSEGESILRAYIRDYAKLWCKDNSKMLQERKVNGECAVRFVVREDGSITSVQVEKGITGCPECDQQAIRIVQQRLNKWLPAYLKGKPVNTIYRLQMKFAYEPESKKSN